MVQLDLYGSVRETELDSLRGSSTYAGNGRPTPGVLHALHGRDAAKFYSACEASGYSPSDEFEEELFLQGQWLQQAGTHRAPAEHLPQQRSGSIKGRRKINYVRLEERTKGRDLHPEDPFACTVEKMDALSYAGRTQLYIKGGMSRPIGHFNTPEGKSVIGHAYAKTIRDLNSWIARGRK